MAHMTGGDFARPAREARHAIAALVGAAFHPAQAAGAAAEPRAVVAAEFGQLAEDALVDDLRLCAWQLHFEQVAELRATGIGLSVLALIFLRQLGGQARRHPFKARGEAIDFVTVELRQIGRAHV